MPTPKDESRAITWMPRGLEFLTWIGLKNEFDQISVKRNIHEFWSNKRKLLTLFFENLDSPFTYTAQLPQHNTEQLLEKAALSTALVEIRRRQTVLEAGQHQNTAYLKVKGPDGEYDQLFPWAVGCDGAKSLVRKELNIKKHWNDYGTYSAIADLEMDTNLPLHVSTITLDPKRPFGLFYFSPGRWRFIYRINEGEDRQEFTSEKTVISLVKQKLPDVEIKKFLWASSFRLGQGQSDKYRKGRWVLCGDAAHAMGPSAGAGMMIGILGAWRLGWRLALAFNGHHLGDKLLEDYEVEQMAASNQIQRTNAIIFKNIAIRNPVLSLFRSAGLRFAAAFSNAARSITEQEALVSQVLPVQLAADYVTRDPWKHKQRYDKWVTGKRIPFLNNEKHPHLVLPQNETHTLISIGRRDPLKEQQMADLIAAKFPFELSVELGIDTHFRSPRNGKSIIFAIVRPDQHITTILEIKENKI